MPILTVTEELIKALKKRQSIDSNLDNPSVKSRTAWTSKLYVLISLFIEKEISQFDQELANHFNTQANKNRNLTYYFDKRTLIRAVTENRRANSHLIDALGYYAFRDEWEDKRLAYISTQQKLDTKEIEPEIIEPRTALVSSLSSKKNDWNSYFLSFLLLLTVLFFVLPKLSKLGISSFRNAPKTASLSNVVSNDCTCYIEPIFESQIGTDTINSRDRMEIISWSNINEIQILAQHKVAGGGPPTRIKEESRSIIRQMKYDFPEKENLILTHLFYLNYYCAVDKLYCHDNFLTNKKRRQLRRKNLDEYKLLVDSLLKAESENSLFTTSK